MVWAPESHFGRHIPFSLLTGFLGSGKTTLLNWMLRDPRLRDTAIAVNEFGAISLDHDFIESATDDVIVLSNGCMCCFASEDLEASLADIFRRRLESGLPEFRRLLIETSGLADPEMVLRSVLEGPIMSRFLWLDRVVTTVDALYGSQQLTEHAEARRQVALADTLIITKTDLLDAQEVADLRAELAVANPRATQLIRQDPALDLAKIFSTTFFDEGVDTSLIGGWVKSEPRLSFAGGDVAAGTGAHNHQREEKRTAIALTADSPIDWRAFRRWLGERQREYGLRLLRVKGILDIEGSAEPVVVHAIQSTLHVPVSLREWPNHARGSRLVFILSGDIGEELTDSWCAFLAAA